MIFVFLLVFLAMWVFLIVAQWKFLEKGKQPGWSQFIPIYNIYCILTLAGKPPWWLLLCFIPFVNFIVALILPFAIAKNFGKDAGFGIALLFFPFIGIPILAFGDAEYIGPIE